MVGRPMKRYLPFVLIAAVAGAALLGGTTLFKTKQAELAATVTDTNSAEKPGAKPAHIRGDAMASVTIEEFGDFQCPPCEGLAGWLPKVERANAGKVRIVFRNFPLQMHNHALEAAWAAEAAGVQGKFWEMHDLLYRNRASWADAANATPLFEGYASQLGLNTGKFKADAGSETVRSRVSADQERSISLGVTSTPTIFLKGQRVPPQWVNEKMLHGAINDALSGRNPFPTPTPATPPAIVPNATP